MHRYHLQPDGAEGRSVEIREAPAGLKVLVGEQEVRLEALPRGAGHLRLRLPDRTVDCHYARCERLLHLWLEGRSWRFRLGDATSAFTGSAAPAAHQVAAPMPGTVRKVLVGPGEDVEADQRVVILESMKMEVSLVSPRAGRIAEVACSEGDLVAVGDVLVRLAPEQLEEDE